MGGAPRLGGTRFRVVYRVMAADAGRAREAAEALGVEQTVEFPRELLPGGPISEEIVGRLEDCRRIAPDQHEVTISYPVEASGGELTQLFNVLFGNSSIKPGIRLQQLDLDAASLAHFGGPRFGCSGLRELLGVARRPLLCTALKPMGLTPQELAGLAARLARGGIDLIKDDHGLADQPFCRFEERVERCAAAVARAAAEAGSRCIYLPNVTADAPQLVERARFARHAGAGGLLLAPGLVGFGAMRAIAADEAVGLPIVAHPALLGSYLLDRRQGIAHGLLLGRLMRLAGADASIFPNFGGRFSFDEAECRELAAALREPWGTLAASFPVPAGGMSVDRAPELRAFYGDEAIFLIGGDLHRGDVERNCRRFLELVSS